MGKKIGILGGTFNPIHYGHLMIADNACQQFDLDEVLFMPTGHAPHKEFMGEEMTEHRCRMTELAIAGNPAFSVSYMETDSQTVNYTYLTLTKLKEEYPDNTYYFILGADSLRDLHDWVRPDLICRQAVILAAVRGDLDTEDLKPIVTSAREAYGGEIYLLDTPNYSISSREIRQRVREDKTIRYMVPESVERYIREHGLYRGM